MTQAEESAGASALSSSRETRASITCNAELLGHFCVSDPQQMDGEALSSNTLAHPSHLPWEGVLRIKEKSGLRLLVENMATFLSEAQSPVSRNSWRERGHTFHLSRLPEKQQPRIKCTASGGAAPQVSLEQLSQAVQYFQMCLQLFPA